MNWKLAILGAVMVVAVLGVVFTQIQDVAVNAESYDVAQTASGGTYADGVLALSNVVTIATDRKTGEIEHLTPVEYLALWSDDEETAGEPIRAEIGVETEGDRTAVIEILGPPIVLGDQTIYSIEILEGSLPTEFDATALFLEIE